MFLGEYSHSIDEKGRLTIPARYRQLLAQGAYITQGFDHNLMVLRPATFDSMKKKVSEMSFTKPQVRELNRFLFSRAELIEPDGSGRILIPQFLRDWIKLDGEAMVVGAGSYFEIWPPAIWKKQIEHTQESKDNAGYFADLDLFANEQ